jgi:hypothetical protein
MGKGTWFVCLALASALAVAGCGSDASTGEPTSSTNAAASGLTTLNTFISDSIQIDQLGSGVSPDDANLFKTSDPADGTASVNKPAGGPGSYIDWNDLGADLANHQLLDTDLASGKDPTSFPLSNECVGTSQVLSKMDLRYVASANNNSYAYFGVMRSDNNGDAGYYWLFTRKAPKLNLGEAPCKSDQQRLLYDISGPSGGASGDVLLAGHFHPNGSPLLRVFHATTSLNGVTAVAAVDYTSSLWSEDASGVAAVAINTTITAPGAFGSAGVGALSGSNLGTEVFAEAAVPISIFSGTGVCGTTFYGSVITRSSGSGGTSPDLKDLAGPALFNFGSAKATASLTPSCSLSVGYTASATGPSGTAINSPNCAWTFSDGSTSSSCSGSLNLGAGSRTGTVKVTDPVSGCSDTITTASVNVCPALSVAASLAATCSKSFNYSATPSGGCGAVTYAWAFSGGGTTTPSTSTSASGSVAVGTVGTSYTGAVTVTDTRTDLSCKASDSKSAIPLAPLAVNLHLAAQAQTCPSMSSDAATWNAIASGGDGNYAYTWAGPSCSGASCTVDPSDSAFCGTQTLSVSITDTSGLCSGASSEQESYTKVTTITATDN